MPGSILRLFVALYPPEDAGREMLRQLRDLDPPVDARHRVTPFEQLHMTLQFIGDTPEHDLDGVIESVARSAAGLPFFSLRPTRLLTIPLRGTPRLVAMETDAAPQLMEIHRRLAQRLARNARAKSGDRFLPHFTLCRFAASADPKPLDHAVGLNPFPVHSISLMKSTLRPEGAAHAEVVRIDLVR